MRASASPGPVAARWAGWATAGAVLAGAALVVVALGLLRRRGWARWAAVVGFSLGAAAALSGLLGTVNAGAGTPPAELAPPAVAWR
jgi:hypothetical protein